MPAYTLTARAINGAVIQASIPLEHVSWGKQLNAPGACTFSLPIRDPLCTAAILTLGQREVELFEDATKIWGGYLLDARPDFGGQTIEFIADGYFSMLRERCVTDDFVFDPGDQLDIAWTLITHTQAKTNGALGFTRASAVASGVTRKRTYCCWEEGTIGDIIVDLAEMEDGFDFEITPTKAWTTWYPDKGVVSPRSFNLGSLVSDVTDVSDVSWDMSARPIKTRLAGFPPDRECMTCGEITVEDASTIALYGLREEVIDLPNLKKKKERQKKVREQIRLRKQLALEISFTHEGKATNYDVGDTIAMTVDLGYVAYTNQPMRVVGWTTTIDGTRTSTAVDLSQEIVT